MTAVIVPNTVEGEKAPFPAPLRDGAQPYRFEMLCHGDTDRAYAETAEELLAVLIRGYERMPEPERLAARLRLAVNVQVAVQAAINDDADLSSCSIEEQVILQGHRNTPPEITAWDPEVPIILVDVYYQPLGELPTPISGIADVNFPPNIFWLSPTEPYDFLRSLHRLGVVTLREHVEQFV